MNKKKRMKQVIQNTREQEQGNEISYSQHIGTTV